MLTAITGLSHVLVAFQRSSCNPFFVRYLRRLPSHCHCPARKSTRAKIRASVYCKTKRGAKPLARYSHSRETSATMAPVIAVDLDEVLGSFVAPLCNYHNEKYGTILKPSDFFSYRFCEVWGGDDASASEKVHDFFKTKHFKEMPIVPGAREATASLRQMGYDLVVVTSRQLIIERDTREWLSRMFPAQTFREVAFGNHWGLEGRKVRKIDLCRELGATMLIDDSISYTNEVAAAGMKALLFDLNGGYGWNKTSIPLGSGVTRVQNWDEALKHIRSM